MASSIEKNLILGVKDFGPIPEAEVEFGDITLLVGPQASGKSLFLQVLKLCLDGGNIRADYLIHGMDFKRKGIMFASYFFGEGMDQLIENNPSVSWKRKPEHSLEKLLESIVNGKAIDRGERLFYIPAQRVTSMRDGRTRAFGEFSKADPYVLRHFGQSIHDLLNNQTDGDGIFSALRRFNPDLGDRIKRDIYGSGDVVTDSDEIKPELRLQPSNSEGTLSFNAWSAGQREFTPLLLGFYHLCSRGSSTKKDDIEWVVIEEPEMGLHPSAIYGMFLLTTELRLRGYKVVISTHSPVILDLVWALDRLTRHTCDWHDIGNLLGFGKRNRPKSSRTREAFSRILEDTFKVYFFKANCPTQDISELDPSSEDSDMASWGGLLGYSSDSSRVVANAVARSELGGN